MQHLRPDQPGHWQPDGGACGGWRHWTQPRGIIVPCHRVIGKDGSLTGYAGGLGRKTKLLDLELRDTAPHPEVCFDD